VAVVAVAVPVAIWSAGGGERGDGMVGVSPPPASRSAATPRPTADPSEFGCPADPRAAQAIGDTVWTGATNAGGKEIVARLLRYDGSDADVAGFGLGLGDRATGSVEMGCMFGFALPPAAAGFPDERAEFDGPDFNGPDRTTTIVGSFVGPVDRITATYDGEPLTVTFRRFSAYPELVVYWVTGVPAFEETNPRDDAHPLVTIYDAAGKVIGPPK
jgi:hypothetical protein